MLGVTDWVGVSVVIASAGSATAAVVAAYYGARVNTKVSTPGDRATIGQMAATTDDAVRTPDGTPTLGQTVSDTSDTVNHVHRVVCNEGTETGDNA